jgi:hypothetical protein
MSCGEKEKGIASLDVHSVDAEIEYGWWVDGSPR